MGTVWPGVERISTTPFAVDVGADKVGDRI
jgi:hypothetical protein